MKFDFDKVIDRRGTGSLKWDVPENELPMWVADMDFQTAPCIREALAARVEHGIFGYSIIPDEWADAYVNWWGSRHGFAIDRDWLVFCSGVIPAISTAVRKLTTPAENVTVYDSFISGEYLGWNAKNLTLVNCTIESLQGMCYIDNLVMKNCKLINTTLAFEYSTVDADICSKIDSVMNPTSGTIKAQHIDNLIIEKDKVDPSKTKIIVQD